MAANNYKIGDRVVVVSEFKHPVAERFNHLRGTVVTICSICERVLEHYNREKFYAFSEARDDGHCWDDSDIAGLAPALPRKHFEVQVGKDVILLAQDRSDRKFPGTIASVGETHFIVQEKWRPETVQFRLKDFVCDDPNRCNRVVVYESEKDLYEDQKLVRLQYHAQVMAWQFSKKIPAVEELAQIAAIMLPEDEASAQKTPAYNKGVLKHGATPMKILYHNREYLFDEGYRAIASSEGNPCEHGTGVILRCQTSGGKWGWNTIDIIHICTFGNEWCANDLAKALNEAKKQGIILFDVDKWINEKIATDAKPESLVAEIAARKANPPVKPHLCESPES